MPVVPDRPACEEGPTAMEGRMGTKEPGAGRPLASVARGVGCKKRLGNYKLALPVDSAGCLGASPRLRFFPANAPPSGSASSDCRASSAHRTIWLFPQCGSMICEHRM